MRASIPSLAIASLLGLFAHSATPALCQATEDWPERGGDPAARLYSRLDQIEASNVERLQVAWRVESPDAALRSSQPELEERDFRIYKHETTPLAIDGILYTSSSLGQVTALDGATGETLWTVDPRAYESGPATNLGYLSRGLAHWSDGESERLLHAPANATLISIDPTAGKIDIGFGRRGLVDLKEGLPHASMRTMTVNSPPIVCRDVVIVGSAIEDTPVRSAIPPGFVRGYDVRTGELRWTFHTIPQRIPQRGSQEGEEGVELGLETWGDGSWRRAGSVNVWPPMSFDPELGYAYLPVGTPSHNWYGKSRPGDNLFATSLVCIECATGRRVWHFQMVHHPIWDYDPPAAPTLIDIEVDGRPIPAVAQVTKQGLLFTFDRRTGEPVWPIEERAVPQSRMAGETTSPTQPFPSKPPPFELTGVSEDDVIDFTPELRRRALELVRQYQQGPLYTPPTEEGVWVLPGWSGGGNWQGAAFDPESHLLYLSTRIDYNVVKMVKPDPARSDFDYVWSGADSPTLDGIPLFRPPFGSIVAIDMDRGEHRWRVANGDGPRRHRLLADLDLPPLGHGMSNGETYLLLTKSLLFSASDRDPWNPPHLRAHDKATGEVLWHYELPAAVHATPMTYVADGRQYLVVALGEGRFAEKVEPDELIAFALDAGR